MERFTAFIGSDAVYKVDSNNSVDLVIGSEGSAVDFGDVSGDVVVDLGSTFVKDKYSFNNVEGFKGGAGDSTLIGSNDSVNAFYGGSGNTTILSGAGADTLHGYEDSDKTGSTKFMYFEGQGKDSIVSFNFGTDNTSDEVLAIGGVDEVRVVGDDLRIFATGDDEDYLTVAEASGEIVKVDAAGQKYTLSLGTNAKYSKDGDFFGNVDTKDNTLTIGSDVTEPVKVMLASQSHRHGLP